MLQGFISCRQARAVSSGKRYNAGWQARQSIRGNINNIPFPRRWVELIQSGGKLHLAAPVDPPTTYAETRQLLHESHELKLASVKAFRGARTPLPHGRGRQTLAGRFHTLAHQIGPMYNEREYKCLALYCVASWNQTSYLRKLIGPVDENCKTLMA